MPTERLSNVVGAPFAEFVLTQLDIRTRRNSIGTGLNGRRSTQEVLFLANKMSWVKLTSSVRIVPTQDQYQNLSSFYQAYQLDTTEYNQPDSLAKNWILQAGTSYSENSKNITLRQGLSDDGAYGLGGTKSNGYRPMPGLTNVTIESKGVLGSLREANLEFKVWNIEQLNVIEALYFRLGYSMILEWGHVQYFDNMSGRNVDGTFTTSDGGIDTFTDTRKETIQQEIAKKRKRTDGNYDGMLGIVSNFTWSFNQEGGYDCTLKIIGLGSIIDTLRINLSYKMPDVLFIDFEKQQKSIQKEVQDALEREEKRKLKLAQDAATAVEQLAGPLPAPATNINQLYDPIYKYDQPNSALTLTNFENTYSYYSHDGRNYNAAGSFRNYYYLATGQDSIRLNNQRTGLHITRDSNNFTKFIPGDVKQSHPQPVVLNTRFLEDRATDINDQFFLRGSEFAFNENFKFFNTFLTPYIKSSNLLESFTGTDYYFPLNNRELNSVDTFVDVNLNRKESIANDINNTIQYKVGNNNLNSIDQISFVYTYQQAVDVIELGETQYRQFYFIFNITRPSDQSWGSALRVLQNWLSSSQPTWNITDLFSVNYTRDNTLFIATLLKNLTNINLLGNYGGSITYRDLVISGPLQLQPDPTTGLVPKITFTTNDPTYITQVLTRPPEEVAIPMSGVLGTESTVIVVNNSTPQQKDEAQKFASALHAMLYAVKSEVQTKSGKIKNNSGSAVDIIDLTRKFFLDGVLKGILDSPNQPVLPSSIVRNSLRVFNSTIPPEDQEVPFDLFLYAKKGFNSSLMADPTLFNRIQDVDFYSLCTAYYIKYRIQDNTNPYNFPVYIKFGYLLAFLNSMCLIYDSKQDTDKHPYVYLDFNPEYNFCLTSPYHLSVDPLTCLIPYEGNTEEYKMLFPESIRDTVFPKKGDVKDEIGLTPEKNIVSKFIPGFKNKNNAYQGKIMEILLNVDFLLDTLKSFTSSDPTHAINLKGFLDAVVVGINKSCGNINMFRVSYDDDSNTVIIKDDQFVPNKSDEPSILNKISYDSNANGNPKYGMIPIFGLNSMVREFEFRTNINTAMSKQIAISAQAAPLAVNSTDHSSFSYLNADFVDAYKPQVTDSTRLTSTSNNSTNSQTTEVDKDQALKLNSHILAIYQGGEYLNPGRIDFAINYYISSMADRKSLDPATYAAPFIPANLSMTIDGISGIVMGNAFTVPEDRLPLSLRGNGINTKVGFIVSGLTHTLDNNQWLTKIKGQMIRLQDVKSYSAPTPQLGTQQPIIKATTPLTSSDCEPTQKYSGAPVVPETESINTDNVRTYYPNLSFTRGKSDIPVTTSLPVLNESEISNDTTLNRFDLGVIAQRPKYFIVHHTGGRGTAKDVYQTFYCKGLPAQYVIDRQGNIHRFMPDGTKGWHAGGRDASGTYYNQTSIGLEIIANDDNDVLDIQVRAAVRLIRYLGFNKDQVIGHGQTTSRKQPAEGRKVVDYIKSL
jgi:hypothetical protein